MSNTIHDIFQTTVSFWDSAITESNFVKLGFMDERADVTTDDSFPKLMITLYDEEWDGERRYSGSNLVMSSPEGSEDYDVVYTKRPVPMNYFFQLDLFAKKQINLQTIADKLRFIIGTHYSSMILPDGYVLYIIPVDITPMNNIDDIDLHRMVFRYYVQYWVFPWTTPMAGNVVTSLIIKYKSLDQVEVV